MLPLQIRVYNQALTFQWGTNLTYWRSNGLPLGYQNMTTAWMFGGDRVVFQGHGVGTFDGNGQLWCVNFACRPSWWLTDLQVRLYKRRIEFTRSAYKPDDHQYHKFSVFWYPVCAIPVLDDGYQELGGCFAGGCICKFHQQQFGRFSLWLEGRALRILRPRRATQTAWTRSSQIGLRFVIGPLPEGTMTYP